MLENNCLFEYLTELKVQNICEVWVREKKILKKKQASAGRNAKPVTPLQIAEMLIPKMILISPIINKKVNWLEIYNKWCLEIGASPIQIYTSNWGSTAVKMNGVNIGWAKSQMVSFSEAMNQFTQVLQNSMDNKLGNK